MATAAQQSIAMHQQEREKTLGEADTLDKQRAGDERRLREIIVERRQPAHLDAILARDTKALKTEDKFATEQNTLELAIPAARERAKQLRNEADALQKQIVQTRAVEIVERVMVKSVAWGNGVGKTGPLFEELRRLVAQFERDRAELHSLFSEFPESAQAWLGVHFVQGITERFQRLLLSEATAVVTGKQQSESEFSKSMSQIFSGAAKAFSTVAATLAGGAPGRKMFHVNDGAISGLSGGLTVRDGDRICLLVDDPETKRLVPSGNLIMEGE